ncbi:unnamed protein product [Urochloa decumbens]|uniref:Pectinesterase inhibitor domain-containing protein n=1 Tax=Urochloa decumbens TaxID=240449 RepID=A0ABC9HAB9_9POAL
MKMTMAAAASFMLCALFFAGSGGTHVEPTTEAVATSEQVPSTLPVCKTVGGGSVFFDVQFCLEALGSDGRSANAGTDYHTCSVIAADLLTANATTTAAKIAGLLLRDRGGKGVDDEATTLSLRTCEALYGGVVRRQQSGCAAVVRGRRSGEATRCLEEAASAAEQCEDGFRKSKVASPVTMENDDAFKLAKLAVALLRMAS